MELLPGNAVSIIEYDVNIEFEPDPEPDLNYKAGRLTFKYGE